MSFNKWKICLALAASTCCCKDLWAQTPPAAYANTIKVNYVREWTAPAPAQNPPNLITRPLADVKQTTQYFDVLGRPLQPLTKQISPSRKDMVPAHAHAPFRTQHYEYL